MQAWNIFVRQLIELEGYKIVLQGLTNTVIIAVFGLILGFIIGSVFAVIKVVPVYKKSVTYFAQKVIDVYVTVFRGTPMVVQLLIMHFVLLPILGLDVKNIVVGSFVIEGAVVETIFAFALNSAAYICEIMRGGINSVDKGQLEAGRALGLSYPRTMASIVTPQAFKNVLPTLGNEFIALIKETSVASFISVCDLTKSFQNIANSTYEFIVPYIALAVCYLVLVVLITCLIKYLEKKFATA